MKTIFLKLLLIISILLCTSNVFAYDGAYPPFTNEEVKTYADDLIKQGLHRKASAYYKELGKREEYTDFVWGMVLVDLISHKNRAALKKIEKLLSLEDVQARKLQAIKAEVLITLAEESFMNKKPEESYKLLQEYKEVSHFHGDKRSLDVRYDYLRDRLERKSGNLRSVNIGVILPLTGKMSSLGKEIQKALTLTMYQEQFGNINLYFEDNQSSQEGSIIAATKLVNNSPAFIIGPILRDNVLAANTVIESVQIPLFALSNDDSIAGDNVFINNINLRQEAYEIAKFAIDDRRINLTCLIPDNSYGEKQREAFEQEARRTSGNVRKCVKFDSSKIDIKQSLRTLLGINELEKQRRTELRKLEKEFSQLENAMDDEKITRMEELQDKSQAVQYDINFNGIFIPATPNQIITIAPQLAFYDVDYSSNVIFLGNSSWDNEAILKNKGEHLHFSRFVSLKTDKFKKFEKDFRARYKFKPRLISGFASDILYMVTELNFNQRIYSQIYRPNGFSVLTGNVRFNRSNMPDRLYGINKLSRRKIKVVDPVKHQRAVNLPYDLEINKQSVFNNWFGF
ncbi:MAG: penicillin-binding protein activator [Proteobacteria bacterium]|nr:penicillin-binding protein activator [Pseudomonadota bacterium]